MPIFTSVSVHRLDHNDRPMEFHDPFIHDRICGSIKFYHKCSLKETVFAHSAYNCDVIFHTSNKPVAQSRVNICVTALSLRKKRSGH